MKCVPFVKIPKIPKKASFLALLPSFKMGTSLKYKLFPMALLKFQQKKLAQTEKRKAIPTPILAKTSSKKKNPELYKRYKKASEGVFFERIRPKTKIPDPSQDPSGGFGFSFGQSGFDSNDFSDITDILQELLQNDGQIDLNRILQKQSTQRLMDRFLDSMAEDDPQLQQMLEMQRQMMKQFGLLNDEDANPFGGSQVRPKKSPPKRVAPPKKEPKGTFEQTTDRKSVV